MYSLRQLKLYRQINYGQIFKDIGILSFRKCIREFACMRSKLDKEIYTFRGCKLDAAAYSHNRSAD